MAETSTSRTLKTRGSPKEIIFCSGSKPDLEDITGHQYRYLNLWTSGLRRPTRNSIDTDLEGRGKTFIVAKNNLYDLATRAGADAVVNYSGPFVAEAREGCSSIYVVRGILVARIR